MKQLISPNWTKISLINFLIVSVFGLAMRYKIAFEFPFFNQKNLLHAHSHFAFIGWVSLLLMALMIRVIQDRTTEKNLRWMNLVLILNLICSYMLLISFTASGYGVISIVLSATSIFISFAFSILFFKALKPHKDLHAKKWFVGALLFLVISSIGTFYLSYLTSTKQLTEHAYLSSIYWYLHFQYNGWFFFACIGLFVDYMQKKQLEIKSLNKLFWMFAVSCIPAYGLSVLWLKLPVWIYSIICISAAVNFYAVVLLIINSYKLKPFKTDRWSPLLKFLFLFVGFSLLFKYLLQLGSTVPEIAKFAFGFRPIVIAYLHLVLLAFTSLFLVTYVYMNKILHFGKWSERGIFLLSIGILLNELVLALQGIASLSYTLIPYANEMLFGIALLILISLVMVNFAKINRAKKI